MTFGDYQQQAATFAAYSPAHSVAYPLLGLCGEVGELVEKFLRLVELPPGFSLTTHLKEVQRVCLEAGKLAKRLRDQGDYPNPAETEWVERAVKKAVSGDTPGDPDEWADFRKELGDHLWFAAAICTDLQIVLDWLAAENLAKLADRKARNRIHGDGDNR